MLYYSASHGPQPPSFMSHEHIARTFDEWARAGRDVGMEEGHGDVVRQVIGGFDIRPGEQILDLGCGSGWATRMLAQAAPGAGAIGVDVSPAMVARAEEQHSYTIRARYEVSTFENLGLPDQHFTRVFSMEALYYAVDLERALAEMHRVLKPGGIVDIVLDFYAESPATEDWPEQTGLSMHRLGLEEWQRAFERAGFADIELARVIDSRGPGDPADFEPGRHYPDWETKKSKHEAGSLWIHAVKPA